MCQECRGRRAWQFGRHYSASGAGSAFGALAGFGSAGDGHGWLSTFPIYFSFGCGCRIAWHPPHSADSGESVPKSYSKPKLGHSVALQINLLITLLRS